MRLAGGVSYLLLMVAVLTPGCRDKSIFPRDFKGSQLHFGQGGGFTGEVKYFVLLDDGRLFERQGMDSSYVLRDTWETGFVRQVFANYHALDLGNISYYQPGNLYYFIEFHTPGEKPHVITWGAQGSPPPEQVQRYYRILYQSTRS
jgi:hypothetical protein